MVFDLPFELFIAFASITFILGIIGIILGLRKIAGAPFIIIFAGSMLFVSTVMTDNLIMGYTEERSILTSTLFQDGATTNIVHMNVTTGDNVGYDTGIPASNAIFRGEELGGSSSLIGDTFNNVRMTLGKTGNPTGTLYVGVWNTNIAPTNANYACLINTKDVTTLTGALAVHTFTKASGTCSASSGQIIGAFYNSGTSGNFVDIDIDTNPSTFDSTNSYSGFFFSGAWGDSPNDDIEMQIWNSITTSDIETNSYDTVGNTPILYAFNDNDIWAFLIFISAVFMLIGAMVQFAKW